MGKRAAKKSLTVAEAKKRLETLVENFGEGSAPIMITKGKKRVAVVLPVAEYESLLETIDFLEHPDEVRGVLEGMKDIRAGRTITHEELLDRLGLNGHKRKAA